MDEVSTSLDLLAVHLAAESQVNIGSNSQSAYAFCASRFVFLKIMQGAPRAALRRSHQNIWLLFLLFAPCALPTLLFAEGPNVPTFIRVGKVKWKSSQHAKLCREFGNSRRRIYFTHVAPGSQQSPRLCHLPLLILIGEMINTRRGVFSVAASSEATSN